MNKYKVVSLVLVVALLATLAQLVATHHAASTTELSQQTKAEVVMQNILQRKSVR